MSKQLSKTIQYSQLISDLKKMLEEGKKRAQISVNQIVVETYWKMGKRIYDDPPLLSRRRGLAGVQRTKADGAFEEASIKQIAKDLSLERTLVNRIVKFYQTWPESVPVGHTGGVLSWSHYKTLLAITDKIEREFYLKESFLNDWDRDDLRQKIKDEYAKSQKENRPQKRKNDLERKANKMYLYSAIVDRVVDGDTLLLRVDLGFDVWVNQRIRLRGIDCPEISTPEGQKAKEFVQDKLKNCFIVVIQTFKKIDVHGRYVCDLFYLEDETDKEFIAEKGNFLNQELLSAKLAVQF